MGVNLAIVLSEETLICANCQNDLSIKGLEQPSGQNKVQKPAATSTASKQKLDRGLKFLLKEMYMVWCHAARDDDDKKEAHQ